MTFAPASAWAVPPPSLWWQPDLPPQLLIYMRLLDDAVKRSREKCTELEEKIRDVEAKLAENRRRACGMDNSSLETFEFDIDLGNPFEELFDGLNAYSTSLSTSLSTLADQEGQRKQHTQVWTLDEFTRLKDAIIDLNKERLVLAGVDILQIIDERYFLFHHADIDWDRIAARVITKSAEECAEHFFLHILPNTKDITLYSRPVIIPRPPLHPPFDQQQQPAHPPTELPPQIISIGPSYHYAPSTQSESTNDSHHDSQSTVTDLERLMDPEFMEFAKECMKHVTEVELESEGYGLRPDTTSLSAEPAWPLQRPAYVLGLTHQLPEPSETVPKKGIKRVRSRKDPHKTAIRTAVMKMDAALGLSRTSYNRDVTSSRKGILPYAPCRPTCESLSRLMQHIGGHETLSTPQSLPESITSSTAYKTLQERMDALFQWPMFMGMVSIDEQEESTPKKKRKTRQKQGVSSQSEPRQRPTKLRKMVAQITAEEEKDIQVDEISNE